jgi:hypothetical protein
MNIEEMQRRVEKGKRENHKISDPTTIYGLVLNQLLVVQLGKIVLVLFV